MNISKSNLSDLNAVLTLTLAKEDVEPNVAKALKDYRKKAVIDGFRPGKVPEGLINKMYRKPILLDEINKMVSESLNKYLTDENIQIIGEPIPYAQGQKNIDFDKDTNFEFSFEIGYYPTTEIAVSEKDKIDYHKIKIDDAVLDNYIEGFAKRYGKYSDAEVIEGSEMIKADVIKCDKNGVITENDIVSNDVTLSLDVVKDEESISAFKAKKVGDDVVVNLMKAYPNNYEVAHILKVKHDEVDAIDPYFLVRIKSISTFAKAKLDTDLYNAVFGEEVTTEEQFKTKVKEMIEGDYNRESDYKFMLDYKDYYLSKANVKFSRDFMERWLMFTNEEKLTKEQVDKEYPAFEKGLQWQVIKAKFIKDGDLKVEEQDVNAFALKVARQQFKQYGLYNITDEQLGSYVERMLAKQEDVRRMIDSVVEEKLTLWIKDQVKLNTKEHSMEDFNKLFEESK